MRNHRERKFWMFAFEVTRGEKQLSVAERESKREMKKKNTQGVVHVIPQIDWIVIKCVCMYVC